MNRYLSEVVGIGEIVKMAWRKVKQKRGRAVFGGGWGVGGRELPFEMGWSGEAL